MNKSTWVFVAVLSVLIAGGLAYRHFAQELDSRGATRLMRALEENDTEKVEELLDKADLNVRDKSGQTALFYAARHAQQPQMIYKLILAGADPLTTDKQGYTPLMAAAASNPHPAIVKVLARQGGFSKEQQSNKDKALFVAARNNGVPVIKMLLIAHADPAAQDDHGRQVADYLADNPKLSETEKADLRQVMMMLEILQAREAFAMSFAAKPSAKAQAEPGPAPKSKAAKKPVEKKIEEAASSPQSLTQAVSSGPAEKAAMPEVAK